MRAMGAPADGSRVDNAGEIVSEQAIAVISVGGNDVVNTGRIVGASGVYLGLFGGAGDILVNSGQITANRFDDVASDARLNNAVFAEGVNTRITNLAGGIITAVSSEGAGVRLGVGGGGSFVDNDGLIEATTWYCVDFTDLSATESARLNNAGTIRGGLGSFNGNDTADLVTNRGTMVGQVLLNDGDDRFDGRIEGHVFGGNGADLIDGNGGDDSLDGAANNDTINGGSGRDTIIGGLNVDVLDGGDDDDMLNGGSGSDTLRGGRGAEMLIGDDSKDLLNGGAGADIFVFANATHSAVGASADMIEDFASGSDRIDISALAALPFVFRSIQAFAGGRHGLGPL